MSRALLLVLLVFASGCTPKVETGTPVSALPSVYEAPAAASAPERFDLAGVQHFQDKAAYSGYRTVYILTDRQTGKQYVGVSGIGITELGSHRSGKTTVQDER